MPKIRQSTFFILIAVVISALLLIPFTYMSIYLNIYLFILFTFATWSVLYSSKKIVNTFFIFSVFYVILHSLGPIILYTQGFSYYKEVGNCIIIAYICFAIGYHLFRNGNIKRSPLSCIFLPANKPRTVWMVSWLVFFIGAMSYSIYFLRNWHSIFSTDLENSRVTAMTGNGGLLWLGSLIWLAVYMVYEQRLLSGKYKNTTYFMVAVATVLSILLGFRSALVNPILILFFMKNKKKEIPIRKMIIIALALFAFVGIYGAIRGGGGSSFESLLNEFKVSSVNLNYIFEYFPKRVRFQMGFTYLLDFLTLFSDSIQGTTTWLKSVLKLSFSGGGVTPTMIGEFYMNWGINGVVVGMTVSGAFFKWIDKQYRNPYNSIFLSSLILGYVRPIIRGGYANSIVNLLVYIIGYCGCQFIAKKFS